MKKEYRVKLTVLEHNGYAYDILILAENHDEIHEFFKIYFSHRDDLSYEIIGLTNK